MLEGVFRIHLGAFRYGWVPRDESHSTNRDSPSQKTALSSTASNEGSSKKCLSNGLQSGSSLLV